MVIEKNRIRNKVEEKRSYGEIRVQFEMKEKKMHTVNVQQMCDDGGKTR